MSLQIQQDAQAAISSGDVRQLQEVHKQIVAFAEAAVMVAEGENRELTAKEIKEVDALLGKGDSQGVIGEVSAALDKAKEQAETRKRISLTRAASSGRTGLGYDIMDGSDGNGMKNGSATRGVSAYSGSSSARIFSRSDKVDRGLQKELADVPHAFGQYVIAATLGINSNTAEPIRAALTTGDNSKGGSLVPNTLSDIYVDLQRAAIALIGAGATTVVTDSSSLQIPTVVSDPAMNVKAENALFVSGEPTFGSLLAQPYTHMSEVTGSREWFEDAINAAAMVESVLVRASATKVDYYGLQGTGSAQPLGLLNKPGLPSDAVSGSLDWFDLADSATIIREANHEPTGVILSPRNHGLLMKSTTGDSVNSAQNWLMSPPNLEGKSLFPTNNCPNDKIVIGDFSKLFFCLRQGALLESSNVAGEAFDRHQIKIKLTMRADWVLSDKTAFHVITGIS